MLRRKALTNILTMRPWITIHAGRVLAADRRRRIVIRRTRPAGTSGGHVRRARLEDTSGRHVWRTRPAGTSGGHIRQARLADTSGGHVREQRRAESSCAYLTLACKPDANTTCLAQANGDFQSPPE